MSGVRFLRTKLLILLAICLLTGVAAFVALTINNGLRETREKAEKACVENGTVYVEHKLNIVTCMKDGKRVYFEYHPSLGTWASMMEMLDRPF